MRRTIVADKVGLAELDQGSTREAGRLVMARTRTRARRAPILVASVATPDLVESDITYTAEWAAAGYAAFAIDWPYVALQAMAPIAAARPVTPEYLNVSIDLQDSSAYASRARAPRLVPSRTMSALSRPGQALSNRK